MDNLIRITFPSFSRLAGEKEYLGRAIEKTLFSVTIFIFPFLTGMVILMPYFIQLFPKYQKWEPALLAFLFFALNAILSSVSTPLTNALNAIGKIKVTLGLMVFWTAATWILTPLLVHLLGFNGVAIASAIISASVVGVVFLVKRYVPFLLSPVITPPIFATILMGVGMYFLSKILIHDFLTFFLVLILGGGIYVGAIFLIAKKQIIADIQMIRENLRT